MGEKKPLVSIITPCYNGEHCLSRLLDSIIAQTYRPIEFILVNDGSKDGTQSLAEEYIEKFAAACITYRIIQQENKGLGGAINAGLKAFSGEYLCWPDADDFLEPTSIEQRVSAFNTHPECAVVTSNAYNMRADDLTRKWVAYKSDAVNSDPDQFLHHLNADSIFCSGCHMVCTEKFLSVNPEREIYPARRGQNWQLLLPLYFKYKRYYLDVPLYNCVVSDNSMSKDADTIDEKIRRFNEHETILNRTIDQIERTQHVDMNEYRRFLDDKYAKLRMEVCIKYGNKALFANEYISKQHNIGIDLNDRISIWRMNSIAFRKVYRLAYRIFKRRVPEEIAENILYKVRDNRHVSINQPKVSVLIPVYNGEKYIDQCFNYLLRQRYNNLEIIVVNDGSTDKTEDYLVRYESVFEERGFIYRHIYQKNARLAVAMNNALQYVTGKYVMIYEIDDVLYRDGILEKVEYLESHPDTSMVRNNGYYIKEFDELESNLFINKRIDAEDQKVFERLLLGQTNNWPASYLIRLDDFFEALGPSHKVYEHPGGTHLQFMLPMAYCKKVGFLVKPLMDYYAHADSDSHSGGYEAVKRRTNWYEEIRLAVLDTLDMPEDQRKDYRQRIKQMYNKSRMDSAIINHDKEMFDTSAKELGLKNTTITITWWWNHSIGHKALGYVRKIWDVIIRRVCNYRVNVGIWIKNMRGYI